MNDFQLKLHSEFIHMICILYL